MNGRCMCNDTNCLSYRPAQDYNRTEELVLKCMTEIAQIDGGEEQTGCDKLVRALSQFPQVMDLLCKITDGIDYGETIAQIQERLVEPHNATCVCCVRDRVKPSSLVHQMMFKQVLAERNEALTKLERLQQSQSLATSSAALDQIESRNQWIAKAKTKIKQLREEIQWVLSHTRDATHAEQMTVLRAALEAEKKSGR